MKLVKEAFVLIGLALFGMSGAAVANEARVTLDVEVSVREMPSSPGASHPPELFSGTFEAKTSLGKEAKLAHEYGEGRSFVLTLTPTLTEDWKPKLDLVLTDRWDAAESRLEANLVVAFGEAAVFHSNNFGDRKRTWHISVTPRR